MKLYIENDKGIKTEIKEIDSLNKECDILLLHLNNHMRRIDIEELEHYMSEKIGKKVIILDCAFDKVMGM